MANIVTVLLRANDQITPMLAGLRSNLNGLGNAASGKESIFDKLGLGDAAVNAKLAGIAAVGAGLLFLKGQIEGASEAQTSIIASAGDVANLAGASFDKAKASVMSLRQEIAKSAAALPGTTAGYTAIANQLIPAIAGNVNGDLELMNKQVLDMSSKLGVLAAVRGVDASQAGSGAARFIGGTTGFGELRQLDVFQKNPLLLNNLRAGIEAKGKTVDNVKDMSDKDRSSIMSAALTKTITAETLARFDGTAASYVESLKTLIFDQDVGIFGFIKPLKEKGGRSGVEAVSELFRVIGLVFGLNTDFNPDIVMNSIVTVIDWFSRLGYGFIGIFNGGSTDNIRTTISGLFDGAVGWINNLIKSISTAISSVDWTKLGVFLGQIFGDLYNAVQNIDWWGVVGVFLKVLIGGIQLLAGFLYGAISTVLGGTFAKMGKQIGSAMDSVVGFLTPIIDGFKTAIEWVMGAITNTINAIKNPIGAAQAASSGIDEGIQKLTGGWKGISGTGVDPYTIFKGDGNLGTSPLPNVASPQSNSSTFAPIIQLQANANMSTSEHVDMLLGALNDRYREYQQGILA